MTVLPFKEYLTVSEPHKALTYGMKRDMGRNSAGRVTVRHQGGGHKKLYRDIDFMYDKKNIIATVKTVEYDPFRTGYIGIVAYKDGAKRYVLLPKTMKVGNSLFQKMRLSRWAIVYHSRISQLVHLFSILK